MVGSLYCNHKILQQVRKVQKLNFRHCIAGTTWRSSSPMSFRQQTRASITIIFIMKFSTNKALLCNDKDFVCMQRWTSSSSCCCSSVSSLAVVMRWASFLWWLHCSSVRLSRSSWSASAPPNHFANAVWGSAVRHDDDHEEKLLPAERLSLSCVCL